jgi:hypothetical protein
MADEIEMVVDAALKRGITRNQIVEAVQKLQSIPEGRAQDGAIALSGKDKEAPEDLSGILAGKPKK